ncbi:hypothetical protein CPC08DRAFT_90201 [Agrocybe pediades]|nr:hypothetical protein CPC08DRAFT_90201 [Agrocybe pediades]
MLGPCGTIMYKCAVFICFPASLSSSYTVFTHFSISLSLHSCPSPAFSSILLAFSVSDSFHVSFLYLTTNRTAIIIFRCCTPTTFSYLPFLHSGAEAKRGILKALFSLIEGEVETCLGCNDHDHLIFSGHGLGCSDLRDTTFKRS